MSNAPTVTPAALGAEGLVRALDETPDLLQAVLRCLEPRLVSAWHRSTHYNPHGARLVRVPMGEHEDWEASVTPAGASKWVWQVTIRRAAGEESINLRGVARTALEDAQYTVDGHLRDAGYLLLGTSPAQP